MAQEYTQAQLEEMVVGKPIDPTIEFYEQAILDVRSSKEAGRRVYRSTTMVKRQIPGVKDYVASEAKAQDIKNWPGEYANFQMQLLQRKSPGLEVIPGISNVERQELIDLKLSTLSRLVDGAMNVPGHLQHLVPIASRIQQAIQAEENRNAEESNQEEGSQEASSRNEAEPDLTGTGQGRPMLEARGPQHDTNVQQPDIQKVQPRGGREPAQGNEEGRQEYSGVRSRIDNWKVNMVWSQ